MDYAFQESQFKDISIIVGKNNAGKSTLIEALRMIAYVADKAIKQHIEKFLMVFFLLQKIMEFELALIN